VLELVAAALLSISSWAQKNERPSREAVSNNGWKVRFVPALEERTRDIGRPKLDTKVVGASDLELRYWLDASPDTINGLVIRRSGDVWSARWISQTREGWPSRMRQEDLGVPKSGWNDFWMKLTDHGIFRLPDGDEINCSSGALDGIGLVVEVLTKQGYRTYRYDNPQLGACAEAKQLMIIHGIMTDEFSLQRFSTR
jgi:hypothetical protein